VIADTGLPASDGRPPADGGVFADNVPVPDHQGGLFALILQILRLTAQDHPGVDFVLPADDGPVLNHGVRADRRAVADDHFSFDDSVRPDLDPGPQLSPGIDDGGGVYPSAKGNN